MADNFALLGGGGPKSLSGKIPSVGLVYLLLFFTPKNNFSRFCAIDE